MVGPRFRLPPGESLDRRFAAGEPDSNHPTHVSPLSTNQQNKTNKQQKQNIPLLRFRQDGNLKIINPTLRRHRIIRPHRRSFMIMLIERSRIPHLQPAMQRLQRRELIGITPSRRKQRQGNTKVVDARGFPFDNVMGHAAVRESDPGPGIAMAMAVAVAGGIRGRREGREGI